MAHFRKYVCLLLAYFCTSAQIIFAQSSGTQRDLDYFITQATKAAPALKDFSNQLLMNRIDSMRTRAGYRPQVSASSAGMYAPRIKGYGYDEVITNGQSLDALLNVNYALISKGAKANQSRALQLQKDSINYAMGLSRLDLKKVVAEQYIMAYDSQQQVEFNMDIFNLLKKEEALLKELTRSNVYKQAEYLTFLVTLKQQQLQYKQAELQLKNDLATLNYLSGIEDTSGFVLTEPILSPDTGKNEHVFFITRFEIDSLKAINDKKNIELNYKPKTSVFVNGGYNSSLVLQPYRNFGASAGFTIAVPIYDGHQKKMQLDKVDLQVRTISDYRDYFISQQRQQVAMLDRQIADNQGLFEQIAAQIRFTRGVMEVDRKLLHTGDIKVADFVIAINNYLAAQHVMRQTNITRLKLINQLNYWNR